MRGPIVANSDKMAAMNGDLTRPFRRVLAVGAALGLAAAVALSCKSKTSSGGTTATGGGTSADSAAPTVTLSTAACNADVAGSVALSATAADNVAVTRVQFFAGDTLIGTATASPYSVTWNTAGTASGSCDLKARAEDAAGNVTDSAVCTTRLKKLAFAVAAAEADGDLGGLSGADAICSAAATAATLTGSWKAWLSDSSTNAIDRMASVGPWYLVDKVTQVFADKASLANGPLAALSTDQKGDNVGVSDVWTGTLPDGKRHVTNHCSDWSSASSGVAGRYGDSSLTTTAWSSANDQNCDQPARLYCFEQ
jgi:hypothetical protein